MAKKGMPKLARRLAGSLIAIAVLGLALLVGAFFTCAVGPWLNQWIGWQDAGRLGAAAFTGLMLVALIAACGWVWAMEG
jgi:hypothetical protein